ncbi:MAG: aminoacyl-tRNA hydrolase [Bacteroidales bacterium]|nr:aminoacyl-tRNA hydrolase [Bacteroidales bacterium]
MKLKDWFYKLCKRDKPTTEEEEPVAKYLIAGLGNVGAEYEGTRHNAGFMVVDALAKEADAKWTLERHAYRTEVRHKGRVLVLIKPTTYMNLSGKAVRHWLQAEKVELENLMVVVDDLALDPGVIRIKKQGAAGGHNGLTDIETCLGTQNYNRLRVGVGQEFGRGQQVDYVLGRFSDEQAAALEPALKTACDAVRCFVTQGIDRTMNLYNKKGNAHQAESAERKVGS